MIQATVSTLWVLTALGFASNAHALVAPRCQLVYTANNPLGTQPAPVASLTKQSAPVPGIAGKATTFFGADGVVKSVTMAADADRTGVTQLTISVDLANGSFDEENTFFINGFADYRGTRVTTQILRPEGQIRFNFPAIAGSPVAPPPPAPLTFRGSSDWSPAAISALVGRVINKIEVVCSADLR